MNILSVSEKKENTNHHTVFLGSSGCGKTYLAKYYMQELLYKQGMNGIAFCSQGDLISMGIKCDDDSFSFQEFNSVDIRVLTPCSDIGNRIHVDPFMIHDITDKSEIDIRSSAILDIIEIKKTKSSKAVISEVLSRKSKINNFSELASLIKYNPKSISLCSKTVISQITRNCEAISYGIESEMFKGGEHINIESMLKPDSGKTTLNIIYINTIPGEEQRQFFMSLFFSELYRWILNNPSDRPKYFSFIDECAPFIPPVKKPSSKESIMLLSKQARKYGLIMMLASQNPVDIDYKSLSQFDNWFIGKMKTEQDLEKVKSPLKSISENPDAILSRIPSLSTGQFFHVSPDNSDYMPITSGILYSEHRVVDEDEIEMMCHPIVKVNQPEQVEEHEEKEFKKIKYPPVKYIEKIHIRKLKEDELKMLHAFYLKMFIESGSCRNSKEELEMNHKMQRIYMDISKEKPTDSIKTKLSKSIKAEKLCKKLMKEISARIIKLHNEIPGKTK